VKKIAVCSGYYYNDSIYNDVLLQKCGKKICTKHTTPLRKYEEKNFLMDGIEIKIAHSKAASCHLNTYKNTYTSSEQTIAKFYIYV